MRRHRPAVLLAALAVGAVVVALAFRGWDRWVEDRLARWAVAELARRTGGAYRLTLGDLSFLPLAGSIAFDSAVVTTDTARNRRRPSPLPGLQWRARGCRVAGLDVLRLAVQRAFAARELACDRVVARVELITEPGREEGDSARAAGRQAESPRRSGRALGLSSFRIVALSLPSLSFTLEWPGEGGGTSILLERARFEAEDLAFDPGATPGEERILSADQARLTAAGLLVRTDTLTEFTIAGLDADLADSTLRLGGVRHEPRIPEEQWARRLRTRRDRIRFEVDSVRARGVAFRAFVATGAVGIRALELVGARLDVLSDRRIPRGRPSRHRTPQQVAAKPGTALRLDSVLVQGALVYREREAESERAGRVSFDSLRARILHLHLPPRGEPLEIEAEARLMGEGPFTVRLSVPLDAPDFRYELSGRLGAMPAAAFNEFLSYNEAFAFDGGTIGSIAFRQTVRNGRATTTVTPRYHGLSVDRTGDGGGLLGSVKRTVEEFVAQTLVVRSSNPADDGEELRTGRTVSRYAPTSTWLRFLWGGLRGALMEVVKE